MTAEPRVDVTRYDVSCLPVGHIDAHHFTVSVERRSPDQWAVMWDGYCLHWSGRWDYEPQPSSRTDRWKKAHRFDLETALSEAQKVAPTLTVNGWTVDAILARASS